MNIGGMKNYENRPNSSLHTGRTWQISETWSIHRHRRWSEETICGHWPEFWGLVYLTAHSWRISTGKMLNILTTPHHRGKCCRLKEKNHGLVAFSCPFVYLCVCHVCHYWTKIDLNGMLWIALASNCKYQWSGLESILQTIHKEKKRLPWGIIIPLVLRWTDDCEPAIFKPSKKNIHNWCYIKAAYKTPKHLSGNYKTVL